jgi:hypothetical protein
MAAWVAGSFARVTTTCRRRVVPCGHSSLRSLIAATPSTLGGKLLMSVDPMRR